jgi:hypothetical protein
MIEGLKVTVLGTELRDLAAARATHHAERRSVYAEQVASMEEAKVEGMQYTNGDPVRALKDRMQQHDNEQRELEFIAAHIDLAEHYLLAREDLRRLGIVARDSY